MALALLWGCVPDSRDFDMPDSAVYFVDNVANNGIQSAVMYDIQTEVDVPVYVYCSGFNGGTPAVSTSVAYESIIHITRHFLRIAMFWTNPLP